MKKRLLKSKVKNEKFLHSLFDNNQIRDFVLQYNNIDDIIISLSSEQDAIDKFGEKFSNVLPPDEFYIKLLIEKTVNKIENQNKILVAQRQALRAYELKQEHEWKCILLKQDCDEQGEQDLLFIGTDEEAQDIVKKYDVELKKK